MYVKAQQDICTRIIIYWWRQVWKDESYLEQIYAFKRVISNIHHVTSATMKSQSANRETVTCQTSLCSLAYTSSIVQSRILTRQQIKVTRRDYLHIQISGINHFVLVSTAQILGNIILTKYGLTSSIILIFYCDNIIIIISVIFMLQ